jgi:hypothetical protein
VLTCCVAILLGSWLYKFEEAHTRGNVFGALLLTQLLNSSAETRNEASGRRWAMNMLVIWGYKLNDS